MLIIGTKLEIEKSTKKFLLVQFNMKDLEAADVILTMKILYTKDGNGLLQSHYIENMLKKYNYFDLPQLSMPYDCNKNLRPNTERPIR